MLPEVFLLAVKGLIVLLVAEGLKALSSLLGRDLSGWSAWFASVLGTIIVFALNTIFAELPQEWQTLVLAILALLEANGLYRITRALRR